MSTADKNFEILETVGKGAFGTVYRAEMTGPGGFRKAVALKVLNDSLDDQGEFAERLRDEARILGLLNHRAIVRVDGLRRWDGRWAVVMEFVEGLDLKHVLAAGALPVGPALEIVEEVASALDSAFNATDSAGRPVRLLHRDIKPSNIHLTAGGEVKVLDFGVARADFQARESETKSIFFGSIGYMGPERMDGIDSHAGDVYALGVVLCELIIGRTLGRSWANPDRHESHRTAALQALWGQCPDQELYDLVGRCMSYTPEHRPTARELSRTLRGIRTRYPAPWLRDWAEEVVPQLVLAQSSVAAKADGTIVADPGAVYADAGRTGTDVMSERGSSASLSRSSKVEDIPQASSRSFGFRAGMTTGVRTISPSMVAAAAAVVALIGILPLGAVVAWMVLQDDAADVPVVEPVVHAPVERSDDAAIDAFVQDDDEDALDELGEADEPAAPAPDPPAQPRPTEATPEPAAPPPPRKPPPPEPPVEEASTAEAVPMGRVVVTGEARSVRLFGGGSSYSQGSVPSGTYSVKADFGTGSLTSAGSVTVEAGGVVTLTCRAGMKRCVAR